MPHPYAELGRLDIVPVDEERDYYERLTALAMGGFQQEALVRVGSILRAWLKTRRFPVEVPDYHGPNAERTAAYDYVLVDSRTGVSETGGLCIGPLSDQLIVLTALLTLRAANCDGEKNGTGTCSTNAFSAVPARSPSRSFTATLRRTIVACRSYYQRPEQNCNFFSVFVA